MAEPSAKVAGPIALPLAATGLWRKPRQSSALWGWEEGSKLWKLIDAY
ncbi:MAG: hypothetical protein PHO83_04840 [Geobacteraceae bacterium]|nr:hypothetical protein [Geobacteraceae bacterium]